MTDDDWNEIIPDIRYKFNKDSYFSELKETEILKERLDMLNQVDEFVGKYYSSDWVRKNILKQTEEEIRIIDTENMAELAAQPQQMLPPAGQESGLIQ